MWAGRGEGRGEGKGMDRGRGAEGTEGSGEGEWVGGRGGCWRARAERYGGRESTLAEFDLCISFFFFFFSPLLFLQQSKQCTDVATADTGKPLIRRVQCTANR